MRLPGFIVLIRSTVRSRNRNIHNPLCWEREVDGIGVSKVDVCMYSTWGLTTVRYGDCLIGRFVFVRYLYLPFTGIWPVSWK